MWKFVHFGILISLGVHADLSRNSPVTISTPLGKLEGFISVNREGREFSTFLGVPYASAPERFQVSEPIKAWDGVKSAKKFGNACPQLDPVTKTIIQDEECLYLNVYTPVTKPSSEERKLPVMVWFHCGGFKWGKSNDIDPNYFINDLIVVTVNYRLGALGFLATGSVHGNMGLKDQVLSLKWISQNISPFGGDPSKVTIFGNSAGGASVHYHLLSSMSKELFHSGISQSGTATAPWALQRNPEAIAKEFGKHLQCSFEDSDALVNCLKKKSVKEIIEAQNMLPKWGIFPFSSFAPVVETQSTNQERFLEDLPINILKSGNFNKLPWITGFVEDEGILDSITIILNETRVNEINEDWSRIVPIVLSYDHIVDQELKDNITSKILNHYFGSMEIGEETWEDLSNLLADRFFVHPADQAARLHAKHAQVYTYEFTFPGGNFSPLMKQLLNITGDYGVLHTDELQYQFHGFYGGPKHDDPLKHEVYDFSKKFVKLWTSFAKDNKPTATWEGSLEWNHVPQDIGKSPIQYYQISAKTSVSDGDHQNRISLWDELNFETTKSEKLNNKDEL